jgi:hypothetical protein
MLLTILANNVMIKKIPEIPSEGMGHWKDDREDMDRRKKLQEQNNLAIAMCKAYTECQL